MMDDLQHDGFTGVVLVPHNGDAIVLSQNIVQIMQMLQLYQAEIARILGLQCAEVAALVQSRYKLEHGSLAWQRALLLVRLYASLHRNFHGDVTAMYHWLHRNLSGFDATPHRLLVDYDALEAVTHSLNSL